MSEAKLRAAARRAARSLGVPTDEAALVLEHELAVLLHGEQRDAQPDEDEQTDGRPRNVRFVSPGEAGGSYVHVPFISKAEQALPLKRVLAYAAGKMAMDQFRTAELMTYMLEGIADQVASGHVVRVPGFGIWGPWLWESDDGTRSMYPRFVPARPFRLQVRSTCDPARAQNKALSQFQRSHHPSSRPDKAGSTTWSALHAFRQHLKRQAGEDVDDAGA